jgi:hypothetical protein
MGGGEWEVGNGKGQWESEWEGLKMAIEVVCMRTIYRAIGGARSVTRYRCLGVRSGEKVVCIRTIDLHVEPPSRGSPL